MCSLNYGAGGGVGSGGSYVLAAWFVAVTPVILVRNNVRSPSPWMGVLNEWTRARISARTIRERISVDGLHRRAGLCCELVIIYVNIYTYVATDISYACLRSESARVESVHGRICVVRRVYGWLQWSNKNSAWTLMNIILFHWCIIYETHSNWIHVIRMFIHLLFNSYHFD